MASEAFYTTAAQVLPTVLIALAIEMGTIMLPIVNELKAHWAEEQRRWIEEHLTPKLEPLTAAQRALRRGLQAALCVTAAFLAGEISDLRLAVRRCRRPRWSRCSAPATRTCTAPSRTSSRTQ